MWWRTEWQIAGRKGNCCNSCGITYEVHLFSFRMAKCPISFLNFCAIVLSYGDKNVKRVLGIFVFILICWIHPDTNESEQIKMWNQKIMINCFCFDLLIWFPKCFLKLKTQFYFIESEQKNWCSWLFSGCLMCMQWSVNMKIRIQLFCLNMIPDFRGNWFNFSADHCCLTRSSMMNFFVIFCTSFQMWTKPN